MEDPTENANGDEVSKAKTENQAANGKHVSSSKKESLESLKKHQAAKKVKPSGENEEISSEVGAAKGVSCKKSPYDVLFEQNQDLANELERCRHRLILKDNEISKCNDECYSLREYIYRLEQNLTTFKSKYDEREVQYLNLNEQNEQLLIKYEELLKSKNVDTSSANRTYDIEVEENVEAVKKSIQVYAEMMKGLGSKLKTLEKIMGPVMSESQRKSIFSSTLISSPKDQESQIFDETTQSKSTLIENSPNETKTMSVEDEEEEEESVEKIVDNTGEDEEDEEDEEEEDEEEEEEDEEEEDEEEEEEEDEDSQVQMQHQVIHGKRLSTILETTVENEATRAIRKKNVIENSVSESVDEDDEEESESDEEDDESNAVTLKSPSSSETDQNSEDDEDSDEDITEDGDKLARVECSK